VAPVLERLVFPRCREPLLSWIRSLADLGDIRWMVAAHYDAPVACSAQKLRDLASELEQKPWAPDQGDWVILAAIDRTLLRLKLVPAEPTP
jgi:hypothetical protein